jgi:Ca2+-binding EF-hand superfamily protein
MKRFRISLGSVLVLFLVITGTLFAQKGARDKNSDRPMMKCEDMFTDIDANKDGKIDMKEFEAKNHPPKNAPRGKGEAKGPRSTEELFKERDKNSDGFLSREEFCAKDDSQRYHKTKPRK